MPERTLVDCDFPQELQVVGDREAHSSSCLASGICDDAKSYDDRPKPVRLKALVYKQQLTCITTTFGGNRRSGS